MKESLIDVTDDPQAKRFRDLISERVQDVPGEWRGLFFVAYLRPGRSQSTHVFYRANGTPYFHNTADLLDRNAITLLEDIPDSVDPDRAERAAVVATYRAQDGVWWVGCAFGDAADAFAPSPATLFGIATELSPL